VALALRNFLCFLFLACHKFHMMKKECISRWNLGVFRVQGPFVFVSIFKLFSALSRSWACASVTTQSTPKKIILTD
jgi:hypothetical protein